MNVIKINQTHDAPNCQSKKINKYKEQLREESLILADNLR